MSLSSSLVPALVIPGKFSFFSGMVHKKKLPFLKNAHENLDRSADGSSNSKMIQTKTIIKKLKIWPINDTEGGTFVSDPVLGIVLF